MSAMPPHGGPGQAQPQQQAPPGSGQPTGSMAQQQQQHSMPPLQQQQQPQSGGLLPALSPDASHQQLQQGQPPHPQQPQQQQQQQQPFPPSQHMAPGAPRPGGMPPQQQHGHPGQPQHPGASQPHSRTHTPQHSQHNVFQAVMGARPGQVPQDDVGGPGNVKVYASAYSQIPVFEAMIRNISVMRRMADSWVNATQILKVAGISKSVRTKILEKQVQTQTHEKVQGGYGKYQGTWIPLDRGRVLAEQYGVLQYLAPIFDFIPPPSGPPALPMRGGSATPNSKTAGAATGVVIPGSGSGGRLISPYANVHPPPPPQFIQQQQQQQGAGDMMGQQMMYAPHQHMQGQPVYYQPHGQPGMQQQQPHHQQQQQHLQRPPPPLPHHQQHAPPMGYGQQQQQPPPPQMQQQRLEPAAQIDAGPSAPSGLGPPATINGHGGHHMHGLPPPPNDVYIDAYGQSHRITGGPAAPPPFSNQEPPAKRQRIGGAGATPTAETQASNGSDDDDDDAVRDKPPVPGGFRLSTKPFKPRLSSSSHRRRQQLLSLFQSDNVDLRTVFELGPEERPDWDVDMVIDEQGHTALHWACALAKMEVIGQLIELGADIHRGNYSGETPLIRSVLTANHSEAGTFSQLLELHLGASVRTLDHAYASVIHHIALSAGLKGRTACARGYMAAVLEWIAKEVTREREKGSAAVTATPTAANPNPTTTAATTTNNGNNNNGEPSPAPPASEAISLKRLVDLQDVRGDTALNVAARIGSKPLVNLLLDAGADKAKANKLGLRPCDFGVEVSALAVSAKDAAVANLKTEVKRPTKRSADVLKNISALFEDINKAFDAEMEKHVESLGGVEKSVRVATRSLAERRQQVDATRARLSSLEQQAERVRNARRALEAPDVDWTGRTPLKDEAALPAAFGFIPPAMGGAAAGPAAEPALPAKGDADALVQLRRIAAWEDRVATLLAERAAELEGDGADRAIKYRKVIALCAKVSVDQVDDMLDGLTTAVESDGAAIDLTRMAGLVQRLSKAPVAV